MRLLIVDDEYRIRESMSEYISRMNYGFKSIETAADGRQAWQIAQNTPIDIVISDVVMPVMDGLELIKRIKQINSSCEFIMISGHEEIDYVRQAMQYEAVDYLLKPIGLSDLDSALNKAIDKHQKRLKMHMTLAMMEKQLELNRAISISHIYNNIANRSWSIPGEIEEQLELYHVPLSLRQRMACICLGTSLSQPSDSFKERELMKLMLLRCAEDILQKININGLVGLVDQQLLGIIINLNSGSDGDISPVQIAEYLKSGIEEIIDTTVFAGIGPICDDLEDLQEGCHGAIRSVLESALMDDGKLVSFDQLGPLSVDFYNCTDLLQLVRNMNGKPNYHLAKDILSQHFADFLEGQLRAIDSSENSGRSTSQRLINECIKTIQEQYNLPINLQTTAFRLGVSPNYLGTLFKEMTGQNFSTALVQRRLSVAESLLKNVQIPINQVSERVGFEDSNYFAKVFRKRYQLSPSEFRESLKE